MSAIDPDFDFEHLPGIPAPLPPGERILWQGKPQWRELAIQAFHCRKVAIYFGLILGVVLISGWKQEATRMQLVDDSLITLFVGALALAILGTLAWLSAKVTIYTLTNKRIMIRFGIALQMTINLPFTQIAAANVRENRYGTGDIPLTLTDTSNVNYLVLWPHVRPWRLAAPQPMLRSVPHVQRLAALIAGVVQQQSVAIGHDQPASSEQSAVIAKAPAMVGDVGDSANDPVGGVSVAGPPTVATSGPERTGAAQGRPARPVPLGASR